MLRYYDFETKQFVYSFEFGREGSDGKESDFHQLSLFYAKAHLYAKCVDEWIHHIDKNEKGIFNNDIVIILEGWDGDYRHYSNVDLVQMDIKDGVCIDMPYDVGYSELEVISNVYESPTFIDFVTAYKEQFPSKSKNYDYHKIFDEYQKLKYNE